MIVAIIGKYATKKPKIKANKIYMFNFVSKPCELSFYQILDSATSTPARYLMELVRRTKKNTNAKSILIFNPLFSLNKHQIHQVVEYEKKINRRGKNIILVDDFQNIIGYYFLDIKSIPDVALTFFSCVDFALDQQWMSSVSGQEVDVMQISMLKANKYISRVFKITVKSVICSILHIVFSFFEKISPFRIVKYKSNRLKNKYYDKKKIYFEKRNPDHKTCYPTNGFFLTPVLRDVYRIITRKAIDFYEKNKHVAISQLFCNQEIYAFSPYHAGDVLFSSLPIKQISSSFVKGLVVFDRYVDICNDLNITKTFLLEGIPPYREEDCVLDDAKLMESLPTDRFYQCFRLSRDYNRTDFHLLDHFAFACGDSVLSEEALFSKKDTTLAPHFNAIEKPSVLLHFDAGWGLKVYPKKYQQELVEQLLKKDIKVVMLFDKDKKHLLIDGADLIKFSGFYQLKRLILDSHVVVGSDSFPCHYSAHVLGVPTIHLFGSTKPVNSNAIISKKYDCLTKEKPCCPCAMLETCRVNGGNDCANFERPNIVFSRILRMFKECYQIMV